MLCVLHSYDTQCIVRAWSQLNPTPPIRPVSTRSSPDGPRHALLRGMPDAHRCWCGNGGTGTLSQPIIGRGSWKAQRGAASRWSMSICWRDWRRSGVRRQKEIGGDSSAANRPGATEGEERRLAHDRALAGGHPVRRCNCAGRRILQRHGSGNRRGLAGIQPWHGRTDRWPAVTRRSRGRSNGRKGTEARKPQT